MFRFSLTPVALATFALSCAAAREGTSVRKTPAAINKISTYTPGAPRTLLIGARYHFGQR